MTTVTGVTVGRALEIEGNSIVDAELINETNNLLLHKGDGTVISIALNDFVSVVEGEIVGDNNLLLHKSDGTTTSIIFQTGIPKGEIENIDAITQADYDALVEKEDTTLYVIVG